MNESLYTRLKQYKNRQLSEAERMAFEHQMQTDPAFAEEVSTLAAIFQGIQEKGDAELNAQLTGLGKQLLQAQSGAPEMTAKVNTEMVARRFAMSRWAYAAAAMLLLLLLAWPIYQRYSGPENTYASAETLYSEHFNPAPAPSVRDAARVPWKEAYDQKQYPQAIAALEQLLADSSYQRRGEAYLYLGIAHLGAGQSQKAIEALQQVSEDSFEWEEAQWYKAMAYLKMNNIAQAKDLLQVIAGQAGNARKTEATQILKQIK